MMLRALTNKMDVYSIQNNAEEILYAIDGLEKIDFPDNFVPVAFTGAPILFTGLETRFVLNDVVIPLNFSNCLLYQGRLGREKEGRLIKFMDGSTFSKDTEVSETLSFKKGDVLDERVIKAILAAKNVKYIEDDASKSKTESSAKPQTLNQEIWFARDEVVMDEALTSANSKDIILYPEVNGKLKIIWYHGDLGTVIYELRIIGLIQLDNKVVLRTLPEYHDSVEIAKAMERGLPNYITSYKPLIFNLEWIKRLEERGFNIYKASGLPDLVTNPNNLNPSIWNK